ncbi:MAG: CBS domain-containing protein [Anaerolineae bacterium]|jgi:CBS domain-containing protein
MAFISELLGRPVAEADGRRIGRLIDLVASVHNGIPHPKIVALVVKRPGSPLVVPFSDVAVLIAPAIPLTKALAEIIPYQPGEHDLYLARNVLDKQIIDTNGMRVVRVNDLELARVNGWFYVANVDIGTLGLLRRLGLARLARRVAGHAGRGPLPGVIPWDAVELLPGDEVMHLRVPGDKIAELHAADLAEILSDLSRSESGRLLESLDVKTVADTLEEVEPDFQVSLIQTMSDGKVADVLEEMAPDEAADLLAELPEDRSKELVELMEREEAENVRRLLAYREDTAGGIMTTDFVAVHAGLTAEQIICTLREIGHEAETIFYVYVTGDDNSLVGVFSLRELILAHPEMPVGEFMERRVVTVRLLDPQEKVAQVVAKYNLLAVPVVDDRGWLQGIVTADDALDKIIPTAWKKRLPRLYH